MIQHLFSPVAHTANKKYYDLGKLPDIWSRGLRRWEARKGYIAEWCLVGNNIAWGWYEMSNWWRQLQNILYLVFSAESSNTWWLALSVHIHNYIVYRLLFFLSYLIFLYNFSLKTQHGDVGRKSYGSINNAYAPEGIKIMLDKNK